VPAAQSLQVLKKGMINILKKLGEQLYVYQDTCQVYVIKEKESCVLIDFGSGEVLNALAEIGVKEVTAILVTHHHRDQIQGLKIANQKNIPIWVPHQEQDLIADADNLWQRREIYNNYNNRQDRFSILSSVEIAGTLKDYSVHTFDSRTYEILPTPGHTTGSISVATKLKDEKLCFTGDLIYQGGRLWSLAATQWTYNGGEGIPYHVLSLLSLKEKGFDVLLPSHGEAITSMDCIDILVETLSRMLKLRKHNPRLFLLQEKPYEEITEHVLFNRTSMANSYVLLSESKKALFLDFGYDFMAGPAAGVDRSSRRPWLYTIPKLMSDYGVTKIDACIPTHYHDDHVAGFNLMREVYQARILCPENFADILEQPMKYDLPCLWYDPIAVDERLPLNQKIQWEEYEITLHPLSGHTKYEVAIEFTADGKRFLCTGDQYETGDRVLCNYVYKNKFEFDDFIKSAQLIREIKPDLLLSGHWTKLDYTQELQDMLEELGREVYELHHELLPDEEYGNNYEDFPVILYPYQKVVKKEESFALRIQVTNPFRQKTLVKAKLLLPKGFDGLSYFEAEAAAGEAIYFETVIKAPTQNRHRERIACDVIFGHQHFGEQAEMLVTVKA
jgi:glyoxylase-like metal-dependent hydrolase (beta-lactamase superfamily II)